MPNPSSPRGARLSGCTRRPRVAFDTRCRERPLNLMNACIEAASRRMCTRACTRGQCVTFSHGPADRESLDHTPQQLALPAQRVGHRVRQIAQLVAPVPPLLALVTVVRRSVVAFTGAVGAGGLLPPSPCADQRRLPRPSFGYSAVAARYQLPGLRSSHPLHRCADPVQPVVTVPLR